MITREAVFLWLALAPLVAAGQSADRVAELRSKAIAEGSVAVKVTTKAAVDAAATSSARTQAQRFAAVRTT